MSPRRRRKNKRGYSQAGVPSLKHSRSLSTQLLSKFQAQSEEEKAQYINNQLEKMRRDYPKLLEALSKGIVQTNPVQLLSALAFEHLFRWGGEWTEKRQEFQILQPQIELIQALALQHTEDQFAWFDPQLIVKKDRVNVILRFIGLHFFMKRWPDVLLPREPPRVTLEMF